MRRKSTICQYLIALLLLGSTAFAADGDPVIEGLTAATIDVTEIQSVTSIDATTETTLEAALDHDSINGAGTVDTTLEVQGVAVGGDLSGTVGTAAVSNDSHEHTSSTISGIDISADTNLSGDTEIVLTDDALSIAASIARDAELPTASSLSVDDLITLSGVAEGAVNLGAFTGSTIDDNLTVKAALQDVESAIEGLGGGHDAVTLSTDLGNNLLGLSTQQLTLDNQTANYVFAGPASGAAAAPAFRALVAGDMPAVYLTAEVDGSITNEIQDLSKTGDTLSLTSDGTTVSLSEYYNSLDDLKTSVSNDFHNLGGTDATDDTVTGTELDGVFSTIGFLKRTGAATYSTDTSTYLTAEVDGSTTNEIEVVDETYSSANFNGGTTTAVSQDDLYDLIHAGDADDDGKPDILDTTSNGFVKTTGSTGAISIDTSTYITGNQTITLSGDVSGSGTTSITTTVDNDSHSHTSSTLPATTTYLGATIGTAEVESGITLDTEWDTAAEINAATTDADFLTANQTITLSGDASGSGTTSINVTVGNDNHNHTGATLSGIDISDDTNLAVTTPITLTGDTVGIDASPVFTTVKLSGLTTGYIPYHVADATGLADSPIFRESSSGYLGIGTTDPAVPLEIENATMAQLLLRNDATHGASFQAASTGNLLVDSTSNVVNLNDTAVASTYMKISSGGSGSRTTYLDLIGDDTYTTYGARFQRSGGANSNSGIFTRGTGALILETIDAGPVDIYTASTHRMRVTSAGSVVIGDITPQAYYELTVYNDIYAVGTISGATVTDRTPFYSGDALAEISKISGKDGEIDHSTLPVSAQVKDLTTGETERDLGAMISILTVAVQQLDQKNKELEKRIEDLENQIKVKVRHE